MPTILTTNPTTGRMLRRHAAQDATTAGTALRKAVAAAPAWAATMVGDRATVLKRAAGLAQGRREEIAQVIAQEMGKPLAQARAEIDLGAATLETLAERAGDWLAERSLTLPTGPAVVTHEPLGVVLGLTSWTSPFGSVLRTAANALAAGNCALLKPAVNTVGSAREVERLLLDAGLPPGVLRVLALSDPVTAEVVPRLIADPQISAVAVTGSERTGSTIGYAAGGAVTRTILNLGASDPFVVLEDADLDAAAAAGAASCFANAGQDPTCARRFVVVASVADEFVARLEQAVRALVVGDPTDPATTLGPLAREEVRTAVHWQVTGSVERGARVVVGGQEPGPRGFFYAPTLLDRVTPAMPVAEQEVLGPVAAVLRVRHREDAARVADESGYRLGASVWGDPDAALALGRRIRCSRLAVNAPVTEHPLVPVGGRGGSGFGAALGPEGLLEFTTPRTVVTGSLGVR